MAKDVGKYERTADKGGAAPRVREARVRGIDGRASTTPNPRVDAVMAAAERSGLLAEKGGRIGGRVSPALVRKAKALTGIQGDTELLAFALANVALEDRFAEAFRAVHGTVDPDLQLGY